MGFVILFIVIMIATCLVGVFGWAQIIGNLQNIKQFGLGSVIFTIIIWVAIMGIIAWIILHFFEAQKVALFIGYGVSFFLVLFSGKIQ